MKVRCSLFDATGEPFCLQKWLKTNTADTFETDITIGKNNTSQSTPRCPETLRTGKHKNAAEISDAVQNGKNTTPSKARLQLAGWNIYITNIGADILTPEQITVITRVRWQIELMFKCFKSIGKVHSSRSEKPYRILCEVYAKTHRSTHQALDHV